MADNVDNDQKRFERTLFVGNLDERVTEEILHELMIQAGPVESVGLIKKTRTFAFVLFEDKESVTYAISLLKNVRLFGRGLFLKRRDTQPNSQGSGKRKLFAEMDPPKHSAIPSCSPSIQYSASNRFPSGQYLRRQPLISTLPHPEIQNPVNSPFMVSNFNYQGPQNTNPLCGIQSPNQFNQTFPIPPTQVPWTRFWNSPFVDERYLYEFLACFPPPMLMTSPHAVQGFSFPLNPAAFGIPTEFHRNQAQNAKNGHSA